MRRHFRILLISILLISLLPTSGIAATTIKSGANCSKLNLISTVQGVKFQCVKSGNKLIWKSLPTPPKSNSSSTTNSSNNSTSTSIANQTLYQAKVQKDAVKFVANEGCADPQKTKASLEVQVAGNWIPVKTVTSGWTLSDKDQCSDPNLKNRTSIAWITAVIDPGSTYRWVFEGDVNIEFRDSKGRGISRPDVFGTPNSNSNQTNSSNSSGTTSATTPQLNFFDLYDKPCPTLGEQKIFSFWVLICRQGSSRDLKAGTNWAIYKMVDNKTAPVPITLPIKTPSSGLTFDNVVSRYQEIYNLAYSSVQDSLAKNSTMAAKMKVYVGPNTPNVLAKGTWEDAYNLTLKIYSGFYAPNDIVAVAYNFTDVDWATNQLKSLPQTPPSFSDLPKIKCKSPTDCGAANQGFVSFSGSTLYSVGHYSFGQNASSDPYFSSGGIAIHELTHAIQGAQFHNGDQSNDGNRDFTNLAPCWLIEGQANYTALAAPYSSSAEYEKNIKAMFNGQLTSYLKDSSPNHINTIFQNSLPTPQCHDVVDPLGPNTPYRLGYSVGMYAVQVLTAIGGLPSVLALSTQMAHGMLFPEAFQSVYNYNWDKASLIISTVISQQVSQFMSNGFPPDPSYNLDGSISS